MCGSYFITKRMVEERYREKTGSLVTSWSSHTGPGQPTLELHEGDTPLLVTHSVTSSLDSRNGFPDLYWNMVVL